MHMSSDQNSIFAVSYPLARGPAIPGAACEDRGSGDFAEPLVRQAQPIRPCNARVRASGWRSGTAAVISLFASRLAFFALPGFRLARTGTRDSFCVLVP